MVNMLLAFIYLYFFSEIIIYFKCNYNYQFIWNKLTRNIAFSQRPMPHILTIVIETR